MLHGNVKDLISNPLSSDILPLGYRGRDVGDRI